MTIAPLDIALTAVVLLLTVRATVRGFVSEIGSVAALVLGLLAAFIFSVPAAALVETGFGASPWSRAIAFLAIFVATYLVIKLMESLLRSGVDRLSLWSLDRALGFLLGLAEGVLVVTVLLIIITIQPFIAAEQLIERSLYARFLFPLLGLAVGSWGPGRPLRT